MHEIDPIYDHVTMLTSGDASSESGHFNDVLNFIEKQIN
jgi:hypothetical protein